MRSLGQQQTVKPRLKYHLMDHINNNPWRRSELIVKNKPISIVATLDLRDVETKYYYLQCAQLTGTTACLITIGYERG